MMQLYKHLRAKNSSGGEAVHVVADHLHDFLSERIELKK